ncbi:MAG TPA: nucleotide exchange factor GrpE [bacterium]|nr:nucleotide exchange factor GrpE [bacterium]
MTDNKKEEKEKEDKIIADLTLQVEENLNGWKRARADYDNLKKETQKEKEEFVKFANLNLVIGLIPVYDNLKLSFQHLPEELTNNGWTKGILHIKNQFKEVLNFNAVEEIIPKIGDEFNPELHEAVDKHNTEKTEKDNNKIKEVLSDGYKLNGRVFKPARVIVE